MDPKLSIPNPSYDFLSPEALLNSTPINSIYSNIDQLSYLNAADFNRDNKRITEQAGYLLATENQVATAHQQLPTSLNKSITYPYPQISSTVKFPFFSGDGLSQASNTSFTNSFNNSNYGSSNEIASQIFALLQPQSGRLELSKARTILTNSVSYSSFRLHIDLANQFMSKYAELGDSKNAEQFLQYMTRTCYIQPNFETYKYLVRATQKDQRLNPQSKLLLIEKYLECVEEQQFDLNASIYLWMIYTSFNTGSVEIAANWIKKACNKFGNLPDEDLTLIIAWYLEFDQRDPATDLFLKLLKLNESKQEKAYATTACNYFLSWYSNRSHSNLFDELLQTMEKNNIPKNDDTYSIMIDQALNAKRGQYTQTDPILKEGKINDLRWKKANEIFSAWKNFKKIIIDERTRDLHCQNMTTNFIKVQILNWFVSLGAKQINIFIEDLQNGNKEQEIIIKKAEIAYFIKKHIPKLSCVLLENNRIILQKKTN